MAKVSLRTYDSEIEGLIEDGERLDEAIAHCRHVLKTYPKQLETYRLLGKAYLEAKRYNEAVDVFQRVLMAAPDDFVAHVGMSIIADEQSKLDEAIWHMERAFEVQPSNAAIQGELKRLFGRRDGVEPPKIRLTRGALAHMYVQGDLFAQAISEIRAVLNNDPKRSDMQTLLAKAYFRNGQMTEATDICSELLTRYPYCLDANRLMVEILTGTQHAASVQDYRQRVNELDPYAAFAQGSVFDTEKVPDGAVSIERLDYTDQPSERGVALGIGLLSDSAVFGRTAHQPGWLRGASAPDALGTPTSSQGAVPVSQGKDELPGFLRQAGWSESAGESESELAAVQGDLPDWVKALAPADEDEAAAQPSAPISEGPSQLAEKPEWLRNLGGDQPAALASSSENVVQEDSLDWINNLGGGELDELAPASTRSSDTDWLSSLRTDQPTPPEVSRAAGTGPEPSHEPSLDWLKDFDNDLEKPTQKTDAVAVEPTPQPAPAEPSANLGSLGTTAQEQDDALAWLEGLAPKHGAKAEELVTDPNTLTTESPQWVEKAKEIGEQALESALTRPDSEEDAAGIWLRNLQPGEPESLIPNHEVPGPLDLRKGLSDTNDFTVIDADVEKKDAPIMAEPDTPDWLSNLGQKPPQRSPVENGPDWLHATPAEPVQSGSSVLPASAPASESVVDLPYWLAGLDKEGSEAASPGAASDDLSSWVQTDVEPEPQTTERTSATDWQPVDEAPATQPVPEVSEPKEKVEEATAPAVSVSQAVGTSTPSVVRGAPPSIVAPKAPALAAAATHPNAAPASVTTTVSTGAGRALADAASLGGAQSELGRGNIAAALDIYGRLIRRGKSLQEIIRDLRDALYRYPVEVPIWQALGDAYMRANRLQEALDAYTKAEQLLR